MAGFELLRLSQPPSLATPFEGKLISKSSSCKIYCISISVLLGYSHFAYGVFIVAYFRWGWGQMLICLPTQSGLLLVTCYLSFSPAAWKIMGSRASSQVKASGNRLRHGLLTHPPPTALPNSVGFIFPFISQATSSLRQITHPFCNSHCNSTVSLRSLKVQSTVYNFLK